MITEKLHHLFSQHKLLCPGAVFFSIFCLKRPLPVLSLSCAVSRLGEVNRRDHQKGQNFTLMIVIWYA